MPRTPWWVFPIAALVGCSSVQEGSSAAVGAVSAGMLAQKASYLKPEYLAAVGVAYALYDPWAPNWEVDVVSLGDQRVRFELRLRALHTGGEGEARQVVLRSAERVSREQGYSGFELLRYEEGVESSRPFARRQALAEVRLYKSRTFPAF
ncbi:MAG: hypothetical protein JNJ44_02095 [Zoogloeaceae bacterium]|nr:hypothetical protein [Zoogloeaceae bacterium]